MRFTGKLVLSILAFVSILLALFTFAIDQKIGNAQRTQATVQKLLSNDKVSLAVGTAFIDQFYKDIDPELKAKIKAPRSVLNKAAAKAIQLESGPFSVQVGRAYDAFFNNQTAVLHLHEIVVGIKKALHAADKNISVKPSDKNGEDFTLKANNSANYVSMLNTINSIKRLINAWWIFLLMTLGLFVGIAFLDKRKKVGAWRWPGFILFISGGIWLLATSLLPGLAGEGSSVLSDSNLPIKSQDTLDAFSNSLSDALTTAAAGATLIGAVLIILSFFIKD